MTSNFPNQQGHINIKTNSHKSEAIIFFNLNLSQNIKSLLGCKINIKETSSANHNFYYIRKYFKTTAFKNILHLCITMQIRKNLI